MAHIDLYELLFQDTTFNLRGETQVCCPFPHHLENEEYYENNPSAGINLSKGLFHCFSCGRGFNKIQFAAEYFKIDERKAIDLINVLENSTSLEEWETRTEAYKHSVEAHSITSKLGFTNSTMEHFKIGYTSQNGIDIPIIYKNRVVDIVKYFPSQVPKYKRNKLSISGLIFPYDEWVNNTKNTIICAGEKDCLCLRQQGLNAISFTGGESYIPSLFLDDFKNRNVYIIYDNDETGHRGAMRVATALKNYAENIYNVDISSVCTQNKEDVWDFFNKYKKTKADLIKLLRETKALTEEDYKKEKEILYPLVNLYTATTPKYIDKLVRSNIQVVAVTDQTFQLPTQITAQKGEIGDGENDKMIPGETRVWELTDHRFKDIFYLIGSKLKETEINKYIKELLLKIGKKETNITIKKDNIVPVYKLTVTDIVNPVDVAPLTEFTAYSINNRLENGKKYTITYKLVPHPQDGQKLNMVIKDVEESDEFLDNFKITNEVKNSLKKFQPNGMTEDEKFNDTIQRVKGILHYDADDRLIEVIDLWYHTVLQFSVGSFKNIRGYLDTLLVGESRIGKSSTAQALHEMYELGKIISLAGNSATPAGLIGGSNIVAGSYQTRAGTIPQNNKGAVIFEELIKCNSNLIRELTEIRSSNKVRISRVNGNIELPALVRMLTITNPRPINGMSKPINEYPNGISVLTDLIGTAEDIARYDMIAIFGFDANKQIDPFFEPLTPYTKTEYKTRIRWIWSRKPEQIIISKEMYSYTIEKCNILNNTYKSHIKIFGIESWQKILRLAIAIAGYLVSTDDTFENIIVKKYHIDKATNILVNLYDNSTFKFKQYCDEENKHKGCTPEDINNLQQIYNLNSIIIDYLNTVSSTTRNNLQAISGVNNEQFVRIINSLSKYNFITYGLNISPTDKFKQAYDRINKNHKTPQEVTINVDVV